MPTTRNYRGFGGGGYGGRGGGGTLSMSFPPFTGAVKWLIIVNASIYLLMLLLEAVAPTLAGYIGAFFFLRPALVTHGFIWQVVTYGFFHTGLWHLVGNMFALWMFGSTIHSHFGRKQFLEFYFFCMVSGALVTIAVSYLGLVPAFSFLGTHPNTATVGASGAIFGVMIAFAMLYGDQEFMIFPLPFTIRAKYLVGIYIFFQLAGLFQGMGPGARGTTVAYFAHLGGALFGWIYLKFLPRKGLGFATSEGYFGVRNSYYRWKRRRAARKFEVYMSKHDRSQYFDEYGNFRDPKSGPQKPDDERPGPWVN
jgi:membrane associated rhomboid family serine protease